MNASYAVRGMPQQTFAQAGPGHIWLAPEVASWPVSDQALAIAHEARHVQDFADGIPYTFGFACYTFEARAYDQQARTYRALFGDAYDSHREIEVVSRQMAIWAERSGGHVRPELIMMTQYRDVCR